MNIRKCKSCGAQILWANTANGKRAPLDYPGEKRMVIENDVAVFKPTYTSHFATCPHAREHRRREPAHHGGQARGRTA